ISTNLSSVNFSDFGICKITAVMIHTSIYLSLPVSDRECFPGGSTSHFNDIFRTGWLENTF
ncbi:MAG: hypothetical protein AN481_17435, partial [Aphanizomenon flos-aquae LD13]